MVQENLMKQTAQELMTQTTFINLQGSESPQKSLAARQKLGSPTRGGWSIGSPQKAGFSKTAAKDMRRDTQFDQIEQQFMDPGFLSNPPPNPLRDLSERVDELERNLDHEQEANRVDQAKLKDARIEMRRILEPDPEVSRPY